MKKFLFRTIIFISPIISISIFVDYDMKKNPTTTLGEKARYINKHANEIKTIILGTSHAYAGINPKYLNGHAFNLAYPRRTTEYDYLLLQKYEEKLIKLEKIILTYDLFSYHNDIESYTKIYYDEFGVVGKNTTPENYFMGLIRPYLSLRKNQITKALKKYVFKQSISQPSRRYKYRGWESIDTTLSAYMTIEQAQNVYKYHVLNSDNTNINLFDSIIQFGRKNNCKIYFVTTPCYKHYLNCMDTTLWINAKQNLNKLIKRNADVPIYHIDLLKDKRFTYNDYENVNHLNVQGAKN